MLTKSDFKLASTCCKKLVYKKASYKTTNDTKEYMEMLATGSYVIGKYAQLCYPTGIMVKGDSDEQAITETKKLLIQNENITLFEATFSSKGKVVRTDILEKKGNVLNIIEVKSKSYDSESEKDPKKDIKEGTGAMIAYHKLMFEVPPENSTRREQLKKLLLQYCELDTMAMVIIWKYWTDKCNGVPKRQ